MRSWLQDPDGDNIYVFETTGLSAGNYEVKVAINESWVENYGQGGVPGGPNIPFTVPTNNAKVTFTYDATTHVLTVTTPASFSGAPGTSNCFGRSIVAVSRQFGGQLAAAAALGYPSVGALQAAIRDYCQP